MSLTIVLKRKLIGASIKFLFILFVVLTKKSHKINPQIKRWIINLRFVLLDIAYLQRNIPTSESHRQLQNVIVGAVEGPLCRKHEIGLISSLKFWNNCSVSD